MTEDQYPDPYKNCRPVEPQYFPSKAIGSISIPKILPLGKQTHPVLVGRMKDTGNVIIQADNKYVEIPVEWLKETAFALISRIKDKG